MSTSSETQHNPKDDLNDAVPQFGAESLKAAERILSQVVDVPTSPPVAFKLLSMLKKQNQRNEELVEVIKYDANLTASVLKVCNSSIFAGSCQVNSVEDAIIRLGYARLSEMVVTISMGKVYTKAKVETCFNPYDLWRKCVKASLAAKALTPLSGSLQVDPNLAFTLGILHDMGKFALNNCPLSEVGEIQNYVDSEGISFHEAEFKALGTDHAIVGALLLQDWNLSPDIVEATRYHIFPSYSPSPLASLCHVAGICAEVSGPECGGQEQFNQTVDPKALEILKVDDEAIAKVFDKMEQESNSIQSFMMIA